MLEKGGYKEEGFDFESAWKELSKEERELTQRMFHFDEIVLKAAQSFSPHPIVNFLFETAKLYNYAYQNFPILKAKENLRRARLFLSQKYLKILEKGLYLLGIETVEKL